MKKFLRLLYRQGIQLMAVSIVSGLFVGVVITFYNIAAEIIADFSRDVFAGVRQHPGFIPLMLLIMAIGGFMMGTLTYFIPLIKGSGIPQSEAASRGLIRMKWYQVLPAMAAASLFSIFCGMQAGAEGPSIFIGGMSSEGISHLFKGSDIDRRYQITAGASASLAVAFNAPVTGIIFALEEAHRKFTPPIFICAFSSTVTALITKYLLFNAMHMPITSFFSGFIFHEAELKIYIYIAAAAVCTGLAGVGFYKLSRLSKKLLKKITAMKGILRMVIPFLFTGIASIITIYAVGGGHSLINGLATHGGESAFMIDKIFSSPIVVTLLIVIVLRILSTALNVGAGVTGGVFIPMLTIGAFLGALETVVFTKIGMPAMYSDLIVIISMSVFLATTVKSPLTAIILVIELTWQFTALLPVVLAVAIGYMISQLFSIKPLYEALIDDMLDEHHTELSNVRYVTTIEEGSPVIGYSIRDVLWPENVLVTSIKRNGTDLLPRPDFVLCQDDEIVIEGLYPNQEELEKYMKEIVTPIKKFSGQTGPDEKDKP